MGDLPLRRSGCTATRPGRQTVHRYPEPGRVRENIPAAKTIREKKFTGKIPGKILPAVPPTKIPGDPGHTICAMKSAMNPGTGPARMAMTAESRALHKYRGTHPTGMQ